jgi:hypothetical protein
MENRIPYTYKITFNIENHPYYGFEYIGAKWAVNCNPNTFWITYFTSCKIVHQLIAQYGKDSFDREIIKDNYNTIEECVKHESELLNEVDARHNPEYFNQHNGDGEFYIKFVTEDTKKKKEDTFLNKYHKNSYVETDEFKEKSKETIVEKYGIDNVMKSPIFRNKAKETNLQRYGDISPLNNEEIQMKFKETNMERYGVEYPAQNKEIYKKTENTCLEKYGAKHPVQLDKFKEKGLATKRKNSISFICENDNKIWKLKVDAARFYKVDKNCIGRCLRGTQKATGGYKFHYIGIE